MTCPDVEYGLATVRPFHVFRFNTRLYSETFEDVTGLLEPDDVLIQRAVMRDKAAFAAIYDNYVDRVYKYVYHRVSGKADAESITQEVFLRAWKAIDKYRKRTGTAFFAWLVVIARNLVTEHYKVRKHLPLELVEPVSHSEDADPEAITEANLNRNRVRDAISKLKGDKRTVITLRFIEEYSYKEIAEALNKSEGAIRVIQFRALRDLKQILGGDV